MAVDMTAIIEDGPYKGLSVQQMMDHAEAVQAALAEGKAAPAPPAPAAPPPAAVLDQHARDRIDPAQMQTWLRLEQDDEAAFITSVDDYEEFREEINKIKEKMHPQARIMRGVHERLYIHVKTQKPEIKAELFKKKAVVPPVEPPAVPPTPPVTPPTPPPTRPQATPPSTPPVQPPTPPRTPPPAGRTPKLTATAKLQQYCRRMQLDVSAYLLELEDNGVTQDQLEQFSVARIDHPHRSNAYGRARATR